MVEIKSDSQVLPLQRGLRIKKTLVNMLCCIIIAIISARLLTLFISMFWKSYPGYHIFVGFLAVILCGIPLIFTPILDEKRHRILVYFTSFGIGLTVDEQVYWILREGAGDVYWGTRSVIGTSLHLAFIIVICFVIFLCVGKYIDGRKREETVTGSNKRMNNKVCLFIIGLFLGAFVPRCMVLFFPGKSTYISGYEIHHAMTGVAILIPLEILLLFSNGIFSAGIHSGSGQRNSVLWKTKYIFIDYFPALLMGVAIGLIVDEYVFLLMGGVTDDDYWLLSSWLGAVVMGIIISAITLGFLWKMKRETDVE